MPRNDPHSPEQSSPVPALGYGGGQAGTGLGSNTRKGTKRDARIRNFFGGICSGMWNAQKERILVSGGSPRMGRGDMEQCVERALR